MSVKKIFVFDLDGTLLNSSSKLSDDNILALDAAKKMGHILVIATGRNYIYAQMSLKQHWGLFNYFIGCNGALVHSIIERDLTFKNNKIPFKFVTKIINEVKNIGGTIQVSTEWEVFTDLYLDEKSNIVSKLTQERYFDPFPSVFDMTEENKKSIVQISVHFEEHNVRSILRNWTNRYGDKYEFTLTSPRNIDINLKDISKFSAIKEVVKLENIAYENVFIFGDAQNDVKGLEYYNNTYAMSNGLEEAKRVAKNIIGNNDSKDIAKIIKKNILN